jgi:hypothetical protein
MERVKGIEPSYEAWEAAVLPLNYTRTGQDSRGSGSGRRHRAAEGTAATRPTLSARPERTCPSVRMEETMGTFAGTTGNHSLIGLAGNDAVVTVDELSLRAVVSGHAGLVAGDFFLR